MFNRVRCRASTVVLEFSLAGIDRAVVRPALHGQSLVRAMRVTVELTNLLMVQHITRQRFPCLLVVQVAWLGGGDSRGLTAHWAANRGSMDTKGFNFHRHCNINNNGVIRN